MIKRFFDFFCSIFLFFIFSPILVVIFLLIRFKLGKPALFFQIRPGLKGRPFKMIKFRTMLDVYDANGNLVSDDERLTNFGKFLRSFSLDELPELLNVIKGDMSLVGPRPLLKEYLPLYTLDQARRHDVLPGITGWAQVNGRNAISWEDKFSMDVWYVDNRSFWLDIKILLITVKRVLMRESISAAGSVTMTKFIGSTRDINKS
jgi:lipopolysaccharide/colanic/teichoic acid biosynthesis glycosyltransferase